MTLIELLAVLAVVGLLLSLLLAAIQGARESARRVSCLNNLRQIGIAISSYASDTGIFPQGANGAGYSFHAMLLPYLGERPLFDACNFSSAMTGFGVGEENATVARAQSAVFLCPADGSAPGAGGGRTDYAGNRGSGVQKYGYNGAFAIEWDGPIGYEGFIDGTSQTAAVAEWVAGPVEAGGRDPRRSTFETTRPLLRGDQFDEFVYECENIDSDNARVNPLGKGRAWLRGDFGFTLYNHALPINGDTCTNHTAVQQGAWTAGSLHRGGAHVLFADGNARFIPETIDLPIWRALGSRDGREIIPGDAP